jgi:hypothetical protein
MASPQEVEIQNNQPDEETQAIYDAIKITDTDATDDSLHDFVRMESAKAIKGHVTTNMLDNNKVYGQLAKEIKEALDKKYTQSWQCVAGRNFGTKVVHTMGSFIFLVHKDSATAVLVWKAGNASI